MGFACVDALDVAESPSPTGDPKVVPVGERGWGEGWAERKSDVHRSARTLIRLPPPSPSGRRIHA